jgi:hypothetical protein
MGEYGIIVPTRKAQATTYQLKSIQAKRPCIAVGSSPRGHKNLPTLPGYMADMYVNLRPDPVLGPLISVCAKKAN